MEEDCDEEREYFKSALPKTKTGNCRECIATLLFKRPKRELVKLWGSERDANDADGNELKTNKQTTSVSYDTGDDTKRNYTQFAQNKNIT